MTRHTVFRLIALVLAVVAFDRLAIAVTSGPDVGHFSSEAGRDEYAAAYADALAEGPAPDVTRDVPTSFGTVHAHAWTRPGTEGKIPVVLVPGRASGAPMWNELLPELIGDYPVYAFDAIGDAGLSAQSVPLTSQEDQAAWIAEAIAGLGIERAHVVGHSFGGASAAALAQYRPEVVASLALLEPVFVFGYPPVRVFFWSAVIMLPLPQSWIDRGLADIGGTTVADVQQRTPVSEMIDAGAQSYSASLPTPRPLDDDTLRTLSMPVYVGIGGDQSLAGKNAARRAEELPPASTVKVWAGTTHSLPFQVTGPLAEELDTFWDSSEH